MFRERLENILNRKHELYQLVSLILWRIFEREFGSFEAVIGHMKEEGKLGRNFLRNTLGD